KPSANRSRAQLLPCGSSRHYALSTTFCLQSLCPILFQASSLSRVTKSRLAASSSSTSPKISTVLPPGEAQGRLFLYIMMTLI
ncbi:hypothetical protein AKJ16_DCAP14194, partial [Drosera capensis]